MTTQAEEEIEETVFYIASHLDETSKQAISGINRIVRELGHEQAVAYMKQARAIHNAGGQTKKDGSLRTVGGTFFRMVRDSVTYKQRAAIWPQRAKQKERAKQKAEAEASA